jgi:hypothetical protein
MDKALINKHRDINVDYQWWLGTYDSFRADMLTMGVRVDDIYFSGFWSQGDGACFTGLVIDVTELLRAMEHPQAEPLGVFLETMGFCQRIEHRGHYYHAGTMHLDTESVECSLPADPYFDEESFDEAFEHLGELRLAVFKEALKKVDHESLESDILEFLRDKARELYKSLEEEYEYLVSDAAVWETITANDLHEEIKHA